MLRYTPIAVNTMPPPQPKMTAAVSNGVNPALIDFAFSHSRHRALPGRSTRPGRI